MKKFLTFCFIFYLFGFIVLNSAEAGGFWDFFSNLFNVVKEKDIPVSSLNSQTIALLEAPKVEDLGGATGGSDGPTIVAGTAIKAEQGPEGTVADIKEKTSQGQISIYIVREGDNLSQIAQMFGVSVNTIIWSNDLIKGDLIKEGQILVILPVSGIQYTVKEGDTVEGIAKKWKGDVDEIIRFNDLTAGQPLVVGSLVIIPDGQAPIAAADYPSQSSSYRGGGGPVYTGYYIRPVLGGRKSQGLHGWNAVDLAVPCGTPIVASASGDAIMSRNSGWNGGYGNFIVISHPNGTQTLYAHNSANIVGVGWHVVQGQVIGYVGRTGKATGCHVHFEIRGAKNPF